MKLKLTVLLLLINLKCSGQITFQQVYGSANGDFLSAVRLTSDSGYIMLGSMFNYTTQLANWYIIKSNSIGDTVWTKIYGGFDNDWVGDGRQTTDGGYIFSGITESFGAGIYDFLLLKTDPSGNILWSKTFGTPGHDESASVIQTSDGGYALSGELNTFGNGQDACLIKLDANGDTVWTKSYGGFGDELCYSTMQTADSGFVMMGTTPNVNSGGYPDIFVIKTNSSGDTLWTKMYGNLLDDAGYSIIQSNDGGYLIAGSTYNPTTDWDNLLIKIDASGILEWSKSYDKQQQNGEFYSVVQTVDGNYVAAGFVRALGVAEDYCLVKVDTVGNVLWSRAYGGTNSEFAFSVQETSDNGFVIAGEASSFVPGSVVNFYLVKTDSMGYTGCNNTILPLTEYSPFIAIANPGFIVSAPSITITNPAVQGVSGNSVTDANILCRTTSLTEQPSQVFSVSPNPAIDKLFIHFNRNVHNGQMVIISLTGNIVATQNLTSDTEQTIFLKNISPGMYFVKITDNEAGYSQKIIVGE